MCVAWLNRRSTLGALLLGIVLLSSMTVAMATVPMAGESDNEPARDNAVTATRESEPAGLRSHPELNLEDPLPQDDAGAERDADNHCVPDQPPSIAVEPGMAFDGLLRPLVDNRDHYALMLEEGTDHVEFHLEQNADFPPGTIPVRHIALIMDPLCDVLASIESDSPFAGLSLDVSFNENYPYVVLGIHWSDDPMVALPDHLEQSGPTAEPQGLSTYGDPATRDCHAVCTRRGYVATT